MGDCAMIIFGAPEPDEDHKLNAVCCAVLIQNLVEQLNIERIKNGQVPIYFRIGINTGPMLAGNMGSHDRMQYTVVGDAVNLASRLHTAAEKGEIVVSKTFYETPEVYHHASARHHGTINLRGMTDPVTVYVIDELDRKLKQDMENYTNELLAHRIVA